MNLCITCGTTLEDEENGICVNGHDDWLEPRDFETKDKLDKVGSYESSQNAKRRARSKFKCNDERLKKALAV